MRNCDDILENASASMHPEGLFVNYHNTFTYSPCGCQTARQGLCMYRRQACKATK
jgi:hypothetical protein